MAIALCASPAAAQRCNQLAATNVVFTGYSPFGAGVSATATITYDCKKGVNAAWIGISFPRAMTYGASTLRYELYQDAGRSSVWPDVSPLVPVPPTKHGSVTVHAFLPAQDVPAGAYQGTVLVSIYTDAESSRTDTAPLVVETSGFVSACMIHPATLAFGIYDPLGASPLDAQSTIQIACTRDTAYTVGLGTGNNPSGAMRQMANGASRLQYQLYSDGARTAVWDTTATVAGTAASTALVSLPVYGRVAPGQPVAAAGAYQDVVQSTINF